MITEQDKNKVYFSNLLALSYPSIWKEICEVLAKYNYTAGKLTYTKDYWCRDFMPVQVGSDEFVSSVMIQITWLTYVNIRRIPMILSSILQTLI